MTCSPSSTSNSSPTPPTTPTSCSPATTFFEQKDLVAAYGHYYLQISHPAIEPLGECRSNVDLFRELGQRMGFEDACFRDTTDDLIDQALAADVPQLKGITRARLEADPHVRLNLDGADGDEPWLPFADGFGFSNGKARIYNDELIASGMDPVVVVRCARGIAASGRQRSSIRWNFWRARPTTS